MRNTLLVTGGHPKMSLTSLPPRPAAVWHTNVHRLGNRQTFVALWSYPGESHAEESCGMRRPAIPSWISIPSPARKRLIRLYAGLSLFGISDAMLLLAGLGVDPWDVLHQGLSRQVGLGVGTWAIIVGLAVLLLWIPLHQTPQLGTVSNMVMVGLVIDLVLAVVPDPRGLAFRYVVLLAGVMLNGVATGLYIGAGLGPGPRDGLMTGIAARGHSIRVVRTAIELTVLVIGWLLGGSVGIGTVIYAAGIGPLSHMFIPLFSVGGGAERQRLASAPFHEAE
jgi:uncharacterized membrane protein YczE